MTKRFLIAGNWKMNGMLSAATTLAGDIAKYCVDNNNSLSDVDAVIFPPAVHISAALAATQDSSVMVGGQDCSSHGSGAHTGDVSAGMLSDIGCRYVIIGHSERRTDHRERNSLIRSKVEQALGAGLHVILCIGESEEEREHDAAESVTASQILAGVPKTTPASQLTVAYEPVWAIGTGKTASVDDVSIMHAHIREILTRHLKEGGDSVRILYGGSVKPENATDLIAVREVSGFLIGGASLKSESFTAIIAAAANQTV